MKRWKWAIFFIDEKNFWDFWCFADTEEERDWNIKYLEKHKHKFSVVEVDLEWMK